MPTRIRVLAWLGGAALVVGSVVLLRDTETPRPPPEITRPVRIDRFAAHNVVLPRPGEAPARPDLLRAVPATGQLRLSWSDGAGGPVAGYQVTWQRPGEPVHNRLVVAPDTQLDGLTDGEPYQIEVRGIDRFGRRSAPATVTGTPGPQPEPWRAALTGLYDDFADPRTVRADLPGSRWHLSGYRGCVDPADGSGRRGLPIDFGCGADVAVLRARQPMRLADPAGPDGVLGTVTVLTDAAGPGGELTIDLVPGPADRLGTGRVGDRAGVDPSLPASTVRVIVNDAGGRVLTGPGLTGPSAPSPEPAARRGPGVPHRFELVLTTSGLSLRQDGTVLAASGAVPAWREASVLFGLRGPAGRAARVHVAAAGFSGPPLPVPQVVEVPVNPATHRVLNLLDKAPGIGISRAPLVTAAGARLVTTVTTVPEVDPNGIVVQLGERTIAARPATPGPPAERGAAVTVLADLPPDLLGSAGPDPLSPFVLRAAGGPDGLNVVESYLEITPGPDWKPPDRPRGRYTDTRAATPDALPDLDLVFGDAAGTPLPSTTVAPRGQLVLTVRLDGRITQWDSGGVAGVRGFELWLDGRIAAALPTATDGDGVGGEYQIALGLADLDPGPHVLEVREYGPSPRPASLLRNFVIS
ncbi:MAG TPA: fibronectin type III domain-containing protein [Actinophytocola sp.]|uniref:fibronectin type III domain-containing protein n=1 Tax=Actinophytocola sp. TaxID=1872138 RepID=UPI002DB715FF|nr:fibronectin type III domain-containing protein [Actinophytocola sp.]HEU5475294.1 fibronectin type III domain-containing protein [Actinophytocola sp.]